jgi:hypothetical protein
VAAPVWQMKEEEVREGGMARQRRDVGGAAWRRGAAGCGRWWRSAAAGVAQALAAVACERG